jgi:DNA-binding NarL/FixJ family response regulator
LGDRQRQRRIGLSEKQMLKQQIYIVDDQPVAREGLRHLIQQRDRFSVCGESAGDAEDWDAIIAAKPEAMIMEIAFKKVDGWRFLKEACLALPRLRVLVLSKEDEVIYAERVLRAGATGFVSKQESTQTIMDALEQVLSGEIYLSPRLARRLVQRMCEREEPRIPGLELLSDREFEVFRRIGRGEKGRKIAVDLNLSEKTVCTFRLLIKRKLKIKTREELVQRAVECVNNIRET